MIVMGMFCDDKDQYSFTLEETICRNFPLEFILRAVQPLNS
jgi:hypothetical protein